MFIKLRGLAACSLFLWVGSSAFAAESGGPDSGPSVRRGTFEVVLGRVPASLDEMIASSKLIVEATVVSVFPSTKVARNPVSTDIVLAPGRVLKGQLAADRFVVNQVGGVFEGRRHYTHQYPGELMRPGQRYVLFLNDPGPRSPVQPDRDGLVRFVTTDSMSGVVLVDQDKVELSDVLPFRDSLSGMSAARFMDETAAKSQQR